jgi:excisionase family DNA binding protein
MKIYKITEASEYLGVSINTLKTLANNEKIKSFKTTGEHRRFRQEDLDAYMGVEKEKQEKLTVIYARCSTAKQKENLERQKDRLRKHAEAKGYKYVLIDEIASGINEKRNGIHKLIKMCFEGKVERVLIEYKDRLARFGYEYLDAIFSNLEITVEIMEVKDKKYEEELAEDIMKILTCYSARYYGARGGVGEKFWAWHDILSRIDVNRILDFGDVVPANQLEEFASVWAVIGELRSRKKLPKARGLDKYLLALSPEIRTAVWAQLPTSMRAWFSTECPNTSAAINKAAAR